MYLYPIVVIHSSLYLEYFPFLTTRAAMNMAEQASGSRMLSPLILRSGGAGRMADLLSVF